MRLPHPLQDGCGAEAWTHIVGDAQDTILLIEGPLKADIVHYLTGMTLVAVSASSFTVQYCMARLWAWAKLMTVVVPRFRP